LACVVVKFNFSFLIGSSCLADTATVSALRQTSNVKRYLKNVTLSLSTKNMHRFFELIYRCSIFTLTTLKDVEGKTIKELQKCAATPLVKTLQMVHLDKVIFAVETFSVFEVL
jgi:hypothetical protein